MTITALKYQIKNSERVSIYIDGKYKLSLLVGTVLEYKLTVGKSLSEEELSDLLELSSLEKMRTRVMAWCFMRPRSTKEVKDYIKKKLRTPTTDVESKANLQTKVEHLTEICEQKNWVNDEVFASWWVQRRTSLRKSKHQLRIELSQKGIAREVIDRNLMEHSDSKALIELINKKVSKSAYRDRNKLIRYLMSKGYNYSSVTEALAETDAATAG